MQSDPVILRNKENQSGFVVRIIWFGLGSLDPFPYILPSSPLHSFNTIAKKCGNVFHLTDDFHQGKKKVTGAEEVAKKEKGR